MVQFIFEKWNSAYPYLNSGSLFLNVGHTSNFFNGIFMINHIVFDFNESLGYLLIVRITILLYHNLFNEMSKRLLLLYKDKENLHNNLRK